MPGAAEWESVPNGVAHQKRHRDRKVGEPGTPEQDREFAHESRNERETRKEDTRDAERLSAKLRGQSS